MVVDIPKLRAELEDLLKFLPTYLFNPVDGIRSAPAWSWPTLLSLQIGFAIASGAIGGLINFSFWNFLSGLFLLPLSSLFQVVVISFFLSSYFALVHSTYLERQRLFGIVVLANLPYLVLHMFSGYIPLIDLIGFLATCALLVVGLAEHFRLDKRDLLKLMGGVYLVFFVVWGISQYRTVTSAEQYRSLSTPKSLDKLESEL